MPDGCYSSIALCTDADALDGSRTMGRIVDDERARQCNLDRPSGSLCTKGCEYRICAQEQLAAKTAANEWRHQVILSLSILSVVARSERHQSIIWLDVQSDRSSPSQAAMDACGSIMAWD